MLLHISKTLFISALLTGCSETDKTGTDTDTTHTGSTSEDYKWGDIIDDPPMTFFADDLSDNVRDGVNNGLQQAAEAWGNYGPLEYWVLGTDETAGLDLITLFCERRDEKGQWPKEDCMEHQTRTDGEHNFMSYLQVGQQVIETNQPMGSMGRNGMREWGIHLFTSSYPFGFDELFDYVPPEEETKTLFHEYFHAVQHAHIQSMDHTEVEAQLGPTWFVEGGAEYMATVTVARRLKSGEISFSQNSSYPSFEESMSWKMSGGLQNIEENCPGKTIRDISYSDACSYAAYELGAWGIAYLHSVSTEDSLVEEFLPKLNSLDWKDAFNNAFGRTPEAFYEEFEEFLSQPLNTQLDILPQF